MANKSNVFLPYRALGYVTERIPFAFQQRGGESFITTSVGKSWHTYNCARLNLVFVGERQKRKIRAIEVKGDYVFTSCGSEILMYRRGRVVATFEGHKGDVHVLKNFGKHLISLANDHTLRVWDLEGQKETSCITFPSGFVTTACLHPHTLLNKLLVGGEDGSMQLWNLRTGSEIHKFAGFKSRIECIEQSPAVDVVAVGLADGRIAIHNIRYDRTVTYFKIEGSVTSLSFRTNGPPILAVGGSQGHIYLWDLSEKRLAGTMRGAHKASVTRVSFLPGEPVLLTSGLDNSLKMWLFDSIDSASARLLRSRCGHHAPPTHIQFYKDERSHLILSSGRDRSLRLFSTIQDAQNRELSQGAGLEKKSKAAGVEVDEFRLPEITSFASNTLREKDWDNILTCHASDAIAHTWSLKRSAIGKHKLACPRKNDVVTTVCISSCGNYAILGTALGQIDIFSMQSGLLRRSFGVESTAQTHSVPGTIEYNKNAIQAIEIDLTNTDIITASLDGCLRVWEFNSGRLVHTFTEKTPITCCVLHRANGLVACVGDDLDVRVYDLSARKLVRSFPGHTNRVTDLCFSPDGHWICSSSLDCTIRICDLPTGQCVDWFMVDRPCISLDFSPGGDLLATVHTDMLGIYLWANRTQYQRVELQPIRNAPTGVGLPLPSAGNRRVEEEEVVGVRDDKGVGEEVVESMDVTSVNETPAQLSEGYITMSNVPDSRWVSIPVLDEIRERNKPIEPPKAPERAPFFLTVGHESSDNKPYDPILAPSGSRIMNLESFLPRCRLSLLLEQCEISDDYTQLEEYIRGLSPSATEAEYLSLSSSPSSHDLERMVKFFENELKKRANFDLVQAHLFLFLKHFGATFAKSDDLQSAPKKLEVLQNSLWGDMKGMIQNTLCMSAYLADLQ